MRARAMLVAVSLLVGVGLTAAPAGASFPGANGKIAFYDFFEFPRQIHTVDPDGTDPLTITTGPRSKFDPAWSADGSKIAIATAYRSGSPRLETMNSDGSGRTVVMSFPEHEIADPAWSPDSTQLAFCRFRKRGGVPKIFVIGVDGSALTQISPLGASECGPDWSPDGSKIAFVSFVEGGLWTMDPDGSNREQIVGHRAATTPSWSPDGGQLAYARSTRADRYDVFVVNADGTNRTNLTNTDRRWEFTPAWAPDGTSIAFCRVPGLDSDRPCELWVMDPDGLNATKVTDTPDVDEFALSWQPT